MTDLIDGRIVTTLSTMANNKRSEKHSGGFRKVRMSSTVEISPEEAKGRILGAYSAAKKDVGRAGAHDARMDAAAKRFGATSRTLRRWIERLWQVDEDGKPIDGPPLDAFYGAAGEPRAEPAPEAKPKRKKAA